MPREEYLPARTTHLPLTLPRDARGHCSHHERARPSRHHRWATHACRLLSPCQARSTVVAASRDASNGSKIWSRAQNYAINMIGEEADQLLTVMAESSKPCCQCGRRRSRANFDSDAPPVSADLLANGKNARQNSLKCCRRAPYYFSRGKRGVEMLLVRCQYERQRRRANLAAPAHSSRPRVPIRDASRPKAIMTELCPKDPSEKETSASSGSTTQYQDKYSTVQ